MSPPRANPGARRTIHADATPAPKITAAAVSGAIATLTVYIVAQAGVQITAEAGAAIGTLAAFAGGYLKRP